MEEEEAEGVLREEREGVAVVEGGEQACALVFLGRVIFGWMGRWLSISSSEPSISFDLGHTKYKYIHRRLQARRAPQAASDHQNCAQPFRPKAAAAAASLLLPPSFAAAARTRVSISRRRAGVGGGSPTRAKDQRAARRGSRWNLAAEAGRWRVWRMAACV